MYTSMLMVIAYVNCLLISIVTQSFNDIPSLALFVCQTIIFIVMLLRFIRNPDPFGFFRYSFSHEKKCA